MTFDSLSGRDIAAEGVSNMTGENTLGDSFKPLAPSGPDALCDLPEVLTLCEVADVLRCSKAHVCNIVNGQVAGTPSIPAITLGRRKLVRREALMAWILANEKADTIPASPERGRKSA